MNITHEISHKYRFRHILNKQNAREAPVDHLQGPIYHMQPPFNQIHTA